MKHEVIVPQFAEGATVITLKEWLVKVGDQVNRGDNLAEAATDKIAIYIESHIGGYVEKLLVSEGEKIYINQAIAIISEIGK